MLHKFADKYFIINKPLQQYIGFQWRIIFDKKLLAILGISYKIGKWGIYKKYIFVKKRIISVTLAVFSSRVE